MGREARLQRVKPTFVDDPQTGHTWLVSGPGVTQPCRHPRCRWERHPDGNLFRERRHDCYSRPDSWSPGPPADCFRLALTRVTEAVEHSTPARSQDVQRVRAMADIDTREARALRDLLLLRVMADRSLPLVLVARDPRSRLDELLDRVKVDPFPDRADPPGSPCEEGPEAGDGNVESQGETPSPGQ